MQNPAAAKNGGIATKTACHAMNGRGTPFMEQRATAIAGRSALAGSQEIAVPHEAVLRDALLRGVVDVCDAESLGIAEIPFEIVKQRPHEIAGQRHAFVDGALRRGEMTLEIVASNTENTNRFNTSKRFDVHPPQPATVHVKRVNVNFFTGVSLSA